MFTKTEGVSENSLSIAICGIRGIPACYGGFETFAEELGTRLAERGHHVVVYGRSHVISHPESHYRGVELRLLDAPRHKYFETPVHTFRCLLDLLKRPVDVVLVCNAANSPFIWIPRLKGMPVAVNLDGIERRRGKWNMLGRLWYRLGEICSVLFASKMIADADCIEEYYRKTYLRGSEVIRYGCRHLPLNVRKAKLLGEDLGFLSASHSIFQEIGVQPGKYLLYVSRLEPENNAHVVIAAYNQLPDKVRKDWPLLIVGDAPYARDYIFRLHSEACPEVIFAGYRFGSAYEALQKGAYLYIQATEVGGTHPALVEAMGYANCILANGTPENVEVVGKCGLIYPKNDVSALKESLTLCLPGASESDLTPNSTAPERVLRLRRAALERAELAFNWEKITSEYEVLFSSLTARSRRAVA